MRRLATLIRSVFRWRPRFTLRTLLLLVVIASVGMAGFHYWRLLHAPLAWDAYSDERLEFELKQGRIVVVHFTAGWCGPCKTYQQSTLQGEEFRKFARQNSLVTLNCDGDIHPAEFRRLGITSIPTTGIYVPAFPDSPVTRVGNLSQSELIRLVFLIKAQAGNGPPQSPQSPTAAIP